MSILFAASPQFSRPGENCGLASHASESATSVVFITEYNIYDWLSARFLSSRPSIELGCSSPLHT